MELGLRFIWHLGVSDYSSIFYLLSSITHPGGARHTKSWGGGATGVTQLRTLLAALGRRREACDSDSTRRIRKQIPEILFLLRAFTFMLLLPV